MINNRTQFFLLVGFIVVLALNTEFFDNVYVGTIGTAVYGWLMAGILGRRWFHDQPRWRGWWLGLLSLITIVSLVGAILTQVHVVDPNIVYLGLAGLSAAGLFIRSKDRPTAHPERDDELLSSGTSRASVVVYSVLAIVVFATLLAARTGDYIYRYWDLLPGYFWILFGAATIALAAVLLGKFSIPTKLAAIAVLTLLIHGSLLILGVTEYDGDGYRHLSSERYLLLEKPIYTLETDDVSRFLYVGAWSLHAILTQMTGLSLDLIHNLTPYLLASIFPIILLFALGQTIFRRSKLGSLMLAVTPLFFYELNVHGMISNPKTFGYVLLLFSMFLSARSISQKRWPGWLDYLVGLASLLVYPLSGAWSLLFLALAVVFRIGKHWLRIALASLVFLGVALIFPWLDLVLGAKLPVQEVGAIIMKMFAKWLPSIIATEWRLAFPLLLYFLVFLGWRFMRARLPKEQHSLLWLFLLPLLAAQIAFAWRLILPEQPAFTARIGIPFYVTLLPFLAAGILSIVKSAAQLWQARGAFVFAILLLSPFLVASYLQGPFTWSISIHELEAIQAIDAQHPDRNYIVLTEEITAAAANGILGYTIAPYYRYPSGLLYSASIQAAQNPSTDFLEQVRKDFEVETVYYLVNPLPPFTEKSVEQAKKHLPVYRQFGERLFVFRYPPLEDVDNE